MQQETEDDSQKHLSTHTTYSYDELRSRPSVGPGLDLPEDLLHLSHSFGFDSRRRANLGLLDHNTLIFIAGNLVVLLDIDSREQRYLRSCSGGGIGAVTVHPTREFFVVAEKGTSPDIIVYEYPSLRLHGILRGGTQHRYTCVSFSPDGGLLVSAGGEPDFRLTLWDWRRQEVQSFQATSQEVYTVSFSHYHQELLTTAGCRHITFWKLSTTFTGFKLEKLQGHFGDSVASDVESVLELPDGEVVSGTARGNLLLWDGSSIKVEICCKEGRSCHSGTAQPFALEGGKLLTFGSDGAIRSWDFERISSFTRDGRSSLEVEPINELVVGRHVSLCSVVRSSLPGSSVWFAQDSNGGIWRLDLSFSPSAADPKCLLSCHSGPIRGLDVSRSSHLMATTALDGSVRVFDLLSKRELTSSCFNQGGTALCWAPLSVNQKEGLLVTGFEDGVVRLLELLGPQKPAADSRDGAEGDATLHLKQALKPHNAAVTAVTIEPNGHIMASASEDQTVFFFSVREACHPLGFIRVPGPVQALEWSPDFHLPQNGRRLLILCGSGHVVEVQSPDVEAKRSCESFHLPELPRRSFCFSSIKSRLKRETDSDGPPTEWMKIKKEEVDKQEEKEFQPASRLLCGFYSEPGQFWLSMGGFDSGFLYHCKFPDTASEEPCRHQDEPFDFLLVSGADDDPICSMTFSSCRQLLLCGMHSGAIRVYPLQPGHLAPTAMQACWALSVHDSHNGHLRHICCSFDDLFVLTAGDDGNIFSFSRLPPQELQRNLQRREAGIPSPAACHETESSAADIQDPEALSLEAALQKQERDLLRRKADQKAAQTRIQLAELRGKFKQVLEDNLRLPEHVRLTPEELNPFLYEKAKRMTAKKVMKVQHQTAWEQDHCSVALRKLQEWLKNSSEGLSITTVVGIYCSIRVSTYYVSAQAEFSTWARPQDTSATAAPPGNQESNAASADPAREAAEKEVACRPVPHPPRVAGRVQNSMRLRKVAERAERARATVERRRQEWAQLNAEKPDKDFEDQQDVREIQEAKENIGDFVVVKQAALHAQGKREEWTALEEKILRQKSEMNQRITNLRDAKILLVSLLSAQTQQLQEIHDGLSPVLRRSLPPLPSMSPEETPEEKLQCRSTSSNRSRALRAHRASTEEEQTVELSELEKELRQEQQMELLHRQDMLLQQMESSISRFDCQLLLLHRQKTHLDIHMKQAELHLLTLFQEMIILKAFEDREASLQEKLSTIMEERRRNQSHLQGNSEQLKQRRSIIEKLQENERALSADFQASVAEDHHFEDLLTKIFKKKAVHKQKEKREGSHNEDSDDSLEDWDGRLESDTEEEDGSDFDDKVCPAGCDPDLFQKTLQLREHRWDLEDILVEEGKSADALKKESDALIVKENMLKSSQQRVEEELDLINKEKLQKINQLDVVIPLRLHQIKFLSNGSMPLDLSEALVLDKSEIERLERRIQQLQAEMDVEKDRLLQAQQQRSQLTRENKEMSARLHEMEKQCSELMMLKYGRLLDVEALHTMSAHKKLDKLKEEKLLLEADHAKELKRWKAKVDEARQALWEVTEQNTEVLRSTVCLMEQRKELQFKLSSRQKVMVKQQFQDRRRLEDQEDILKLQELVQAQEQQAQALLKRIDVLSSKDSHVLPPEHTRLPPLT